MTVPRLELCGALLSARLADKVNSIQFNLYCTPHKVKMLTFNMDPVGHDKLEERTIIPLLNNYCFIRTIEQSTI